MDRRKLSRRQLLACLLAWLPFAKAPAPAAPPQRKPPAPRLALPPAGFVEVYTYDALGRCIRIVEAPAPRDEANPTLTSYGYD